MWTAPINKMICWLGEETVVRAKQAFKDDTELVLVEEDVPRTLVKEGKIDN